MIVVVIICNDDTGLSRSREGSNQTHFIVSCTHPSSLPPSTPLPLLPLLFSPQGRSHRVVSDDELSPSSSPVLALARESPIVLSVNMPKRAAPVSKANNKHEP